MILVIDNYDSFTYNLVALLKAYNHEVHIIKNDSHTINDIKALNPSGILLSPGPCRPTEAGICIDVVKTFFNRIPILGICLGHQTIAHALGGKIKVAENICHGKTDLISHEGSSIFKNMKTNFLATRYHTLIVDEASLPNDFNIIARSHSDNYIMAIKHKLYPLIGLQFHPESFLTENGHQLIENFIILVKKGVNHV